MKYKFNNIFKLFKYSTLTNLKSLRFYLITLVYLIIYFGLFTYSAINDSGKIGRWNNAVTVSGIITFSSVLFILVFKWGFLERTLEKMKSGIQSSTKTRIEYRAKKMTDLERKIFLENQKEKEIKKQNKSIKSNYPFYFNLILYAFSLILIAIV